MTTKFFAITTLILLLIVGFFGFINRFDIAFLFTMIAIANGVWGAMNAIDR